MFCSLSHSIITSVSAVCFPSFHDDLRQLLVVIAAVVTQPVETTPAMQVSTVDLLEGIPPPPSMGAGG